MFPFLIGTVRTITTESKSVMSKSVSIPHRYGKNIQKAADNGDIQARFPFLIGTVRTTAPLPKLYRILVVSIPHRYGKNRWRTSTVHIGR